MSLPIYYNSNMLSNRQEIILHSLIKEYIDCAEPISSDLLKKRGSLTVSPATIRNELQELTQLGYIMQPHTSAGRVPTEKGYKFFVEIIFAERENPDLFSREIEATKVKIEKELKLAQELTKSLQEISTTLSYTIIRNKSFGTAQDKDIVFEMLKIIGPSRETYEENIDIMRELLKKFENF